MSNEKFISGIIHAKNSNNISHSRLNEILSEAEFDFGKNSLVSYAKSYQENPKALIDSFIKYDSIKMAAIYVNRYARKSGILKELEGQKDFSDYVNRQPLQEKWRGVLEKFLLVIWGCLK